MGIKVEFNPDLALRNYSEFEKGNRKMEECVPENLQPGATYDFLKNELRNYWLDGEIPLVETKGEGNLTRPLASVIILEATHFRENGKSYTKGKYKVMAVFNDNKIHFENLTRIK